MQKNTRGSRYRVFRSSLGLGQPCLGLGCTGVSGSRERRPALTNVSCFSRSKDMVHVYFSQTERGLLSLRSLCCCIGGLGIDYGEHMMWRWMLCLSSENGRTEERAYSSGLQKADKEIDELAS